MGLLSIGKLAFGLPKLFFKYWYIWGFLFFVLPTIVNSVQAGIEGEDWSKPLKDGGRYLASQDSIIEDYVEEAEYEPSGNLIDYNFNFWSGMFWAIWKAVWGIYFTFMILFKFFRWILGDDSASMRAFLVALAIMILAQVLVAGVPFKGLINLGKFIIQEVIL